MIDKKKFLYFNRITIAVIGIFLFLSITQFAFSRFYTDSHGEAISEIAFYTIHPGSQTQSLKMFDIKPDGKDYIYDIQVSNTQDGNVSEVDLEYQLSLRTTTNIPVEYKIYLNGSVDNSLNQREIIQDEDGMYFFLFRANTNYFDKNIEKTDVYRLIVNFPKEYNQEEYQDLIDSVEVTIDAKQV